MPSPMEGAQHDWAIADFTQIPSEGEQLASSLPALQTRTIDLEHAGQAGQTASPRTPVSELDEEEGRDLPPSESVRRTGSVRFEAVDDADPTERIRTELRLLAESQKRIEGDLARISDSLISSVSWIRQDLSELLRNGGGGAGMPPLGRRRSRANSLSSAGSAQSHLGSNAGSEDVGETVTDGFVAATLPRGWPRVLQPRGAALWSSADSNVSVHKSWRSSSKLEIRNHDAHFGDLAVKQDKYRFTGLDPNSRLRVFVDFLCLLVSIFDLVTIPYFVAWAPSVTRSVSRLVAATSSFWTVDLAANFATGFYQDGELKADFTVIAKQYLRTWFLFDLVAVVGDWVTLLTHSVGASSSSFGHAFRLLGLLRVLRVSRIVGAHLERTISETRRLFLRLFSIVGALFLFNHFMACAFYLIGRSAPSDTGARWTDVSLTVGENEDSYIDLPNFYAYATTLHWYTSQMTVGNEVIYCFNSAERVFNIVGLFLILFINCTLVSTLSAYIIEYQMAMKDKKVKIKTLQRYLSENKVGQRMAMLLQQQVLERTRQQDRLFEHDVPALNLVSAKLRADLRFELFTRHLVLHPLFRLWMSFDPATLASLCMEGAEYKRLLPQDELFAPGIALKEGYFVVSGRLIYTQEPLSSPVSDETTTTIHEGSWICEQALWSEWISVGKVEADTECKLLVLSGHAVDQCMTRHCVVNTITREYGEAFHKAVTGAKPPSSEWPTDLEVPFTDYGDLVSAMTQDAKWAIGTEALHHFESSIWGATRGLRHNRQKLTDEVESGKSTLLISTEGELLRVVSVVGMRIRGEDKRVLTQVGKLDGTRISPCCQLPGGKQYSGELPEDTFRRLLEGVLQPIAEVLEVDRTERDISYKESKQHHIRTKYLRTVCISRLTGPIEVPRCKPLNSASDAPVDDSSRAASNESSAPAPASASPVLTASGARYPAPAPASSGGPPAGYTPRRRGSHPFSVRTDNPLGALTHRLNNVEAYLFEEAPGRGVVFAWLTDEDFEIFSGPSGEELIGGWLRGLDFSSAMTEATPTVTHVASHLSKASVQSRMSERGERELAGLLIMNASSTSTSTYPGMVEISRQASEHAGLVDISRQMSWYSVDREASTVSRAESTF